MAARLEFTAHGRRRTRQRGMSQGDVEVIRYFGTAVDGDALLLTERDANRAIQCLERVKNRKVVLGDDGIVITVYRATRPHQKAVLRRARTNGQIRR